MRGAGRRRRAVIVVVVVMAAVLATGCGRRAADTGGGDLDAEEYTTVSEIGESVAADGTTIRVGSARARTTVHLYEDMRCPVCEEFETQGSGQALLDLVMAGKIRVEYTLASFLDDRVGGHGSKKAANALRAALDQGRFVEYHQVLYAHQPEEIVDGYTDAFLLEMASKVDGLRGPEFDAAVKGMKHRDFVSESQEAFDESGAPGTPTIEVDGQQLPLYEELFDGERLTLLLGGL
ncbi:DsbA family protein [Streptomyces sp. SD31]|uniref:DsbA family protein n=1 Tax=Streptomyces sp. SD31 TaxID=3452208 RepID=UPI003F8BD672